MTQIEDFNLYGELRDFPDVVHCETIEERSRAHDWEFEPHRHLRLHQFLLVDAGCGRAVIEDTRYDLSSGDLVNLPAGWVHGFSFEPGIAGWVVTLATELVEQSMLDSEGLRAHLRAPTILKSNPDIRQMVVSIFAEYPTRAFARAHVLRALSGALTGFVARAVAAQSPQDIRAKQGLQSRFEALLEAHFQEHLGVADYAGKLGVTSTHLTRSLREATGTSASAAIEARVVLEARRHLAFSNLRISEIAYQLGYTDPAYFSRVFRRATGKSPRDFRLDLEGPDQPKDRSI